MPSLDETFEELTEKLREPAALNPAMSDPFFYFVHDPAQTLEVKRNLPRWSATLERHGWKVERLSLARILWQVVEASGRWNEWLELESDATQDQVNAAVRDALQADGAFVEALSETLSKERPGTLVLLTDTLALHPYFRVRSLEHALHDRVKTPAVLFYPGRRTGQYGLHFLGFYPEDGNYRATLVGGIP
jgi:Domain of unknown function (DUF1788)